MNRRFIACSFFVWLAASSTELTAEALPSLPPLARVSTRADDASTWRLTGVISGSTSVARYDFVQVFTRQGWYLRCRVPVEGSEAEVLAWRKGEKEILLRLMPGEPGKTKFAIGTWTPPEESSMNLAKNPVNVLDQNNPKERIRKQ